MTAGRCVCGHLRVDHDRRRRQGIAPAQGGDVLDDLGWEAGR